MLLLLTLGCVGEITLDEHAWPTRGALLARDPNEPGRGAVHPGRAQVRAVGTEAPHLSSGHLHPRKAQIDGHRHRPNVAFPADLSLTVAHLLQAAVVIAVQDGTDLCGEAAAV